VESLRRVDDWPVEHAAAAVVTAAGTTTHGENDRRFPLASVTKLLRLAGSRMWSLELFSDETHLSAAGVPITEHSGDKSADIL